MANFLLVHGSWQGAWCWREVVPLLQTERHTVLALDLPGHGGHPSPPDTVILEDYVNSVLNEVRASKEPPILVGHSSGGFVAQVAELIPDLVSGVVFVAGLVPANGSSMMQLASRFDPEYLAQIQWTEDRRTVGISPDGARYFLYPLCPPADVASSLNLLTPEPVAPFESPLLLTPANFGRVPLYYIECLKDRVLPLAIQREISANMRLQHVYSLDTDHSPFFSAPHELAAILSAIAEF
jgi:pimeloyl-ACP methyl ester carboxylesterase